MLGISQIWDPDFETKFGGSLSNNSHKLSGGPKGNLVDSNGRDTVNVLICVDSGSNNSEDTELGGWAPQGLIVEGLVISAICSLGNVLTSIRECQALMSLRSLNRSLQDIILFGGSSVDLNDKNVEIKDRFKISNTISSISNKNTTVIKDSSIVPLLDKSKANDCNTNNDGNIIKSTHDSNNNNNNYNNNNNNSNIDGLKCPDSLPAALWATLINQYNASQLKAIHAVCLTSSTPSTTGGLAMDPSVTLLQGPPGTGKTRTILAIVAALLAGGGIVKKKTGSKVKFICLCFIFYDFAYHFDFFNFYIFHNECDFFI